MALLIGQTLVTDVAAISELTRQAIAFIDGGGEWLRWAVHGDRVRETFADESQMAGALQSGLHGTPFAYLTNLRVMINPIKLMTFSLDDLRLVAEAERDPNNPARNARVKRIFEAHDLVTGDDIDRTQTWLIELDNAGAGLSGMPVLQVLNFHDQVALAQLAAHMTAHPVAPALSRSAAAFAIKEARSPIEFVDFYQIYLGVAVKLHSASTIAETLDEAAQSAVHLLSPLAFHALDCPQTQPLSGPDTVALAVEFWAASGRPVGFARVSACVREIVLHTRFVGGEGGGGEGWQGDRPAWAKNRLEAYLETALALTKRAKLTRPRMGQDGATCRYVLEAGDYLAELQMNQQGVITLESLRDFPTNRHIINPYEPDPPKHRTHGHDQETDSPN